MPLEQSYVTISASGVTAALYCENIEQTQVTSQFYDRKEFTNEAQRKAKETTGVEPTYSKLLDGSPIQIIYGSSCSARPLTPDDLNIEAIFNKFFILRYTFRGTSSLSTDVDIVHGWAQLHRTLQDRFEGHQRIAGGDMSITELLNLQNDTFAYLANTGFVINTNSYSTLSNMLIRDFTSTTDSENPLEGGGYEVIKSWTLVADSLLISPADALTN